MADVVGSVSIEGDVELNTARALDEMGRFASQTRTVMQQVMSDLPSIFQSGMNASVKIGGNAARSLGNAMRNGLSGLGRMLSSALKAAGGALLSGAAALGRGAAQAMGDALKLGVTAAGTAITGILGVSLSKGFGRLTAIDNAEAKLRGFAATADRVPEIMEASTNAVTGTAFGLDQAATSAAQFAAAGIPIEEMEQHLSALANSAAGAGGDFDGMSSIFAKVAARGSVTSEVLNQLTDRGVSGLNALAEHFGKTTEEVQAMVSAGDVSFNDFSAAMDSAMGQAAIEQATTFTGLIANLGASMGRFGAVMQKPFFDSLKAVMPGVMNLFNQFTAVVTPLADIIADRLIPFAERLGGAMERIEFGSASTSADSLFGSLAVLAPVVGGLAAAFAGPLLSSIPVVGTLFSGLTGPVGILAGALIALLAVKPETLVAGFQSIMGALPGIISNIVGTVSTIAPQLAANFAANAPILFQGFATMLNTLVTGIAQLLPILLPLAVEMVVSLATGIVSAIPQLVSAALALVSGLADGVLAALPVLIAAVPGIITAILSALMTALPMLLNTGIEILLALIDGVVTAIPMLISAIVEIVPMILNAVIQAVPMLLNAGIQLLTGLIEGVVSAIPMLVSAITSAIPQLVGAIVEAIPLILSAIIGALPLLISAAVELFLGLVQGLTQAIPQILAAVVGALPMLVSAAIQLFLGLVIGLVQALPQIIGGIIDAIPMILKALIESIPLLIAAAGQFFLGIIDGLIQSVPMIMEAFGVNMEELTAIFGTVWESMQAVWEAIGQPIFDGIVAAVEFMAPILEGVWEAIQTIFATAWENISVIFETVWAVITTVVETAIAVVQGIITAVVAVIQGDWQGAWNAIKGVFETVWNAIKSVVTTIINAVETVITNVINAISSVWSSVWNGIKTFFSDVWSNIVNAAKSYMDEVETNFNNVINFVRDIPDKIIGFFSDMGGELVDSGRALVDGFLDGIKGAWDTVTSWVDTGIGAIRDLFPFSPAKTGPFSGRGWVLYSGQSIGQAFGEGITDSLGGARGDVTSELDGISGMFDGLDTSQGFDAGRSFSQMLAAGLLSEGNEVDRALQELLTGAGAAMDVPSVQMTSTRPGRATVAAGAAAGAQGAGAGFSGLPAGTPVNLTIVDRDGAVVMKIDSSVDNKLRAGSRGNLRSELGVSR